MAPLFFFALRNCVIRLMHLITRTHCLSSRCVFIGCIGHSIHRQCKQNKKTTRESNNKKRTYTKLNMKTVQCTHNLHTKCFTLKSIQTPAPFACSFFSLHYIVCLPSSIHLASVLVEKKTTLVTFHQPVDGLATNFLCVPVNCSIVTVVSSANVLRFFVAVILL